MFNRLGKWGYRWFLFSFYLFVFSDLEKNMYTYTHICNYMCVYYIHIHMYIIHTHIIEQKGSTAMPTQKSKY